MAFDPVQPFVLLDDARAGPARLFTGIEAVVRADAAGEVAGALDRVRALGGERAGFVTYEGAVGFHFAAPSRFRRGAEESAVPHLWFARFARVESLDDTATDALLDAGPARLGHPEPLIDRAAYDAMLARIAALIAAGDVYQVNATFAARVAVRGHPLALFRRLRRAQLAPFGALIHTGRDWLLSLSPELLFDLRGGDLTARPMKGTAPRGATAAADDAAAAVLAADAKNRAENLMIVDLLRSDLSRVAEPGSVAVPALFEVERYPTVLQMTSTVTARAAAGIDAVDVLAAILPCGSITGAPKHRAMQVVAEVEAAPRDAYTGSIGRIGADGDATFNVAIRTLTLTTPTEARLGLGGGIVADSAVDAEWREALAKAAFVIRPPLTPDLIETMRWDGRAIAHRERHLARLAASAAFLGHGWAPAAAEAALAAATAGLDTPVRVRLLLARSGAVAVSTSALPATPALPVAVALAPLPVSTGDWRLRHKTTDRRFYDDSRRAADTAEVVFFSPGGRITEGSFTNVFVARDGLLLTPPLAGGLLPGVLRADLIDTGRAVEAPLTTADLTDGFLLGNALRGLFPARLA